jgi:hypothetical protein
MMFTLGEVRCPPRRLLRQRQCFDLLAYKGKTIRVYFQGREDGSLQTSFAIDDTALKISR